MSEEARFFLRIAIYTAAISLVYWFVSYEVAGTVLLIGIFAVAAFFATFIVLKGDRSELPLGVKEVPAAATIWPLSAALGLTLVATGLVFGPWLWIPGIALSIASTLSWLSHP